MRHKAFACLLVGCVTLLVVVVGGSHAEAQTSSNIDQVERWAWGTNVGWLNLRPTDGGVIVFHDHLEGWAWAENVGWVRFGTATSGFPHHYSNSSPDDYGVNHNGSGVLSGYAWGSNIGWVNFSPIHGGVTIDIDTGRFDGYAWAENVGWIGFRGTGEVAYNVVVQRVRVAIPVLSGVGVVVLVLLLITSGPIVLKRLIPQP